MNEPYTSVTIYTAEPLTLVQGMDTLKTVGDKVSIQVERKKDSLYVEAFTDTLKKAFWIPSQNSLMYWLNIPANYGIGMWIDARNPKRYTYPSSIYLDLQDSISHYRRYDQRARKGQIFLHISMPHINSFYLKPEKEGAKTNTGFWGITLGMDYYHSEMQFLNVGVSLVSDFFLPVPAAVDLSGEHERMHSRYLSLTNHHRLNRFTFGYGLSFAKNTWDLKFYNRFDPLPSSRNPVKKSRYAWGLIFPAYFQLGTCFHAGLIYRPTYFRPQSSDKFVYEHLISIDLAWKIRLGN